MNSKFKSYPWAEILFYRRHVWKQILLTKNLVTVAEDNWYLDVLTDESRMSSQRTTKRFLVKNVSVCYDFLSYSKTYSLLALSRGISHELLTWLSHKYKQEWLKNWARNCVGKVCRLLSMIAGRKGRNMLSATCYARSRYGIKNSWIKTISGS